MLTFCSGQRSVACSLPPQVYLEMPTRRDRLESRIRRNREIAKVSGPSEPSRVYRRSPGLSEESECLFLSLCATQASFSMPRVRMLRAAGSRPIPHTAHPAIRVAARSALEEKALQQRDIALVIPIACHCHGPCCFSGVSGAMFYAHLVRAPGTCVNLRIGGLDPPSAADPLNPPPAGPDAWAGSPLN